MWENPSKSPIKTQESTRQGNTFWTQNEVKISTCTNSNMRLSRLPEMSSVCPGLEWNDPTVATHVSLGRASAWVMGYVTWYPIALKSRNASSFTSNTILCGKKNLHIYALHWVKIIKTILGGKKMKKSDVTQWRHFTLRNLIPVTGQLAPRWIKQILVQGYKGIRGEKNPDFCSFSIYLHIFKISYILPLFKIPCIHWFSFVRPHFCDSLNHESIPGEGQVQPVCLEKFQPCIDYRESIGRVLYTCQPTHICRPAIPPEPRAHLYLSLSHLPLALELHRKEGWLVKVNGSNCLLNPLNAPQRLQIHLPVWREWKTRPL